MNKPKEYIVCSALNYNGTIVAGLSQGKCIQAILELKPDADSAVINDNQGFITSTGRFVDRYDAWDIAVANKQIKYYNKKEQLKGIDKRPILMSIHLFSPDDVITTVPYKIKK